MPASSKIHLPEKIYTPDAMRKAGIRIWGTMTRELWSARELIWRLVYRDISARYRQSVLGYIWAILPPLVTVAIFTFLTSNRVLPIGEMPLPYPVFALWSIGVWQLFSQSLAACTNSLTNAGSLVTKINFPKETLVISAVGQPLIDFLIRLLPTIIVFFWYEIIPSLAALWIPILLIPVILMAIGLGFFFAIANLAIRDIGNAVGMALTFGMFAARYSIRHRSQPHSFWSI